MGELVTTTENRVARRRAALSPARQDQARDSARLLLGAYPRREVNDPGTFVRMLSVAFHKYPADLHMEAIDRLTDRLKFLPTKADVVEVCEELMAPRRAELRSATLDLETVRRKAERRPPATEEEKAEVARLMTGVRRHLSTPDVPRRKSGDTAAGETV